MFDNYEEEIQKIREKVKAETESTCVEKVAWEVGVAHQTVSRFVKGGQPRLNNLKKFESWSKRNTQ